MRITISGPPGSGKTTACNKLSDAIGMKAIVFGEVFREMAAERKMSLAEFGRMAEEDGTIDEMIDSRIIEIAKKNDNIILESRLSAHLLLRNGIPAFKIYLDASPGVRVARVGMRDNETFEQALADTIERQASEEKRYMLYYDIDINDTSIYDLIVNTDIIGPEEVVDHMICALEERGCL
ncbi:MAG: AAA family ATPase [Methanomassiliicoccaceae archaeon]|jgi:predicted cytidylate kinase|nr:AAA family ATPase [Methanomassiliicoccaceae archaeon]